MVKKKTAAKKSAKKAAPARAAKTAPAKKAKAAKSKKPKNEQLELIKGVRYADLDRFCSQIGDNRDEINESKRAGKDIEQGALKAMRLHGVTGYNYRGVTLMVVEGDSKLRVIKAKDGQASTNSGALNQPVAPGKEPADEGTGQGAGNIGEALTDAGDQD
jgi:hypothetical protein